MGSDGKMNTVKRVFSRMKWFYIFVMLLMSTGLFFYLSYTHYTGHLRDEADLLSGTTKQSKVMVERFCEKLESAAAGMMAEKEIRDYDPTDTGLDEYMSAKTRGEISDRVAKAGLVDNYSDFTLVYANDDTAGRLSQESLEFFTEDGSTLYGALAAKLGSEDKVWMVISGEGQKKIALVCHADGTKLFLGSFYAQELESLFVDKVQLPDTGFIMSGVSSGVFLQIGICEDDALADEINKEVSGEGAGSFKIIDYTRARLIVTEPITKGGRVISVRDLSAVQEEYKKNGMMALVIVMAAIVIIMVFNIMVFSGDELIDASAERRRLTDSLTGLKKGSEGENLIADRLEISASGSTMLVAVFIIANMDRIKAEKGVSAENGALIMTAHVLDFHFCRDKDGERNENNLVRTGDDEFTVCADFTDYDLFKAHDSLKESMTAVEQKLGEVCFREKGDIVVLSGTAVFPDVSTDYDELYDKAKAEVREKLEQYRRKLAEGAETHEEGKE